MGRVTVVCNSKFTEPFIPDDLIQLFMNAGIDLDILSEPPALSSTIQDSAPYILADLTAEIKAKLGHSFNYTIPMCFYDNVKCNDRYNSQLCLQSQDKAF